MESKSNINPNNPFLTASALPFQAPDFTKIHDSDFKPAIVEGIRQQQEEMQKIADNPDAPTFENTFIAMEKSGQMLHRVSWVFNALAQANTNPALQKVSEDVAPLLAASDDDIYLNSKLFKRVEAIYNRRQLLKLDSESLRLVEVTYQHFTLAGANLPDAQKDSLKKLNKEEAALMVKFNNQLLAARAAGGVVVTDTNQLAGLSHGEIEAAAVAAKNAKMEGKWLLQLQNTTQQPLLQSLKNRDLREKLFAASWTRAEKSDSNDTRHTILSLARIRSIKAKLLGFSNYAERVLADQMAKHVSAVEDFIGKLAPAATAKVNADAADLQKVIDAQKGGFKLAPWDWEYYAEQERKAKYNLDDNEVKPYFELWNVLENGVFYAANKLYGITFKQRTDIPTYNPDMRVYEVFDKDGSSMALWYCDYFTRDNKSGGAWMDSFMGQAKLLGTKPVVFNVCNFTKPAEGQPALISFDDATTMFHEFGHALHGMFANSQYLSLSGTNTARDFVEFPSQFNEHWASDTGVFKHYAHHYKTGEPMPKELVEKIKKARTFNQGYSITEIIAAAELDMKWHEISADTTVTDVDKFELEALNKSHLWIDECPPRYRSSYFLHIWSNGYNAGYYAYLWTEMLDDDAYQWFKEHGGCTRENGQRFRDMILSRGNTMDLATMYRNFRGRDAEIQPMLENRGLVEVKN